MVGRGGAEGEADQVRPALLNVARAHNPRVAFDPRRDEFAVNLDGLKA